MSENTSSVETVSAVTVKRPSTALNSSKNRERKFKSSNISLQDELQTTEIAANVLGTFLTNQNMQGTVTSEAEDALGSFSKKVDFGPDVKPPAEVQLDVEKLKPMLKATRFYTKHLKEFYVNLQGLVILQKSFRALKKLKKVVLQKMRLLLKQ